MANETMLNSDVANANATVLNTAVNSNATVLNTDIVSSVEIQKGTVLCDDYIVNGKLDIPTGEADLYLCTKKRQTYVAKVYRRKSAIKDEIIKKLLSINSPYVAKIYASGSFNGFPVEILPYYKNGSLKGEKFTLEELREEVIPSLNEGLHALHEVGIIHKDLKPSNIMLSDDGQSVAIIDFGISSVRENDATVVVTRTGMTPEYSAPETFRNAFLEESDYYSLGITIFELYYGKTPYVITFILLIIIAAFISVGFNIEAEQALTIVFGFLAGIGLLAMLMSLFDENHSKDSNTSENKRENSSPKTIDSKNDNASRAEANRQEQEAREKCQYEKDEIRKENIDLVEDKKIQNILAFQSTVDDKLLEISQKLETLGRDKQNLESDLMAINAEILKIQESIASITWARSKFARGYFYIGK